MTSALSPQDLPRHTRCQLALRQFDARATIYEVGALNALGDRATASLTFCPSPLGGLRDLFARRVA